MNKELLAALLAVAIPLSTHAAPVAVSYSATIGFNPSATVGVGGQNAGTLINELFGPGIGSTGTATLTGTFTYESNTPVFNINNRSAGYTNAITGATATIGASTVAADIHDIAVNAATSSIGYNTNPSGGFCGNREGCAAIGLAFTPTGNLVQAVNDSNFFILENGNRVNFFNRDAVSLSIGYTDSHSNFSPLLSTPSFGDINVHGLGLNLISNVNRSLVDSVLLPDSNSFVTSSEVETTLFELAFSGPGLNDNFTLSGQLTSFTTSPVPEPETYAMLLAGLGLVGFIARRRKQIS
ncbi:FxDxF family PEP-CTERM protein [Nitrosovibrio tenuis]|uniref:PEP-CTERM protein-sorting domain-containing protein n=1 Tax=Nitrosovibrio tenuis TaxID=1233 RepID=A0A1H7RRW3_9PROT|nr:FxDxF family PEP-CTERM protein [Nitrosovibrio tenuis]SEL62758.1 PEP-CTERM protein-sorting domain-containing protein [Nitrosovibrio tenuis]